MNLSTIWWMTHPACFAGTPLNRGDFHTPPARDIPRPRIADTPFVKGDAGTPLKRGVTHPVRFAATPLSRGEYFTSKFCINSPLYQEGIQGCVRLSILNSLRKIH